MSLSPARGITTGGLRPAARLEVSRNNALTWLTANLLRKAIESAPGEVIVNGPPFVRFIEAIEDTEDHGPQGNAGNLDDSLREFELFEVGKDLVAANVLTELLALVKHFHTGEVAAPFVIERAEVAAAVGDPEF